MHNRDIVVAGLYCDYLAQEEQSTTNMLGTILKQLFEGNEAPGPLRQVFRKGKRGFGGRAMQLLGLVEILKTTIASLPEVFICIDGLDECLPKNRRELLESLQEIVRALPTTRVLLSGRPHIRDEVERYFTEAIMITVIPTIGDMERYLEMGLNRDPTPSAMDANLRAEIMRVIPRMISQMYVETTTLTNLGLVGYSLTTEYRFILVSLNINAVLGEVTIHARRKKLDEMVQGNGLRSAYSATLKRIQAQEGSRSRLGMEVLMWLSHSEQPLKADELCYAMGVEIGSTDLNSQNIPTIETLLGCSLGLVTVEAYTYTVRLVHYTLQEYLSNNSDLFHRPHSMIAEVCLTYLNFQCIRDLPPIPNWSRLSTPLLGYASRYWGTHARRETTGSVNTLALKLLEGFDKHIASVMLLNYRRDNWDGELLQSNPEGFTGLHCAAHFGIVETAVALLEMKKWDLNATDMGGNTALLWAARKGHGAIVKMLLEWGDVTPDAANNDGQTPLSWAAQYGYGDVVKMLLEREDVSPNTVDNDGRTPLLWAAKYGRKGVLKMLLEREDVSPNTADKDGQIPLSWVVRYGAEGVVKMFLEREDVSPNTVDNGGRTPLSWAAGNRREGVVKMLLGRRDITPNTADKNGRTPLQWAVINGHKDIVKLLLEREDITPDTADKDGRTPLFWAAENGRKGMVKMFLERADVTPDIANKDGQTPLLWAAVYGNKGVVKMLLERGDVSPDTADNGGRTPLSWAAKYGHEGVVEILLEREDVAPDTANKNGQTPLSWAAKYGHEGVVKMLLEREDVSPNTADNGGRTPLHWAAGNGHTGIVKVLLEREDIAPNTTDKNGQTSFLWAVGNGHGGVVKVLLEREDVAPDTADKDGRTPLLWAAGNGHEDIVKMLLDRGGVASNTVDKDGRTPLFWATRSGHGGVVKTLLEPEDLTPANAYNGGRVPLSSAAKGTDLSIVEMLPELYHINHDIVMTDPTGQTALIWTSERHGGALKPQSEDQELLPQAGGNSLTDLFFPKPSEPSRRCSKRIRRS